MELPLSIKYFLLKIYIKKKNKKNLRFKDILMTSFMLSQEEILLLH